MRKDDIKMHANRLAFSGLEAVVLIQVCFN
jgi:hypothetical protein